MKLLFYVLLLLNQHGEADEVKNIVIHENYGVFWTHQGVIEPINNVWHHTFAVEISSPVLPDIEVPCETIEDDDLAQRFRRNIRGRGRFMRNLEQAILSYDSYSDDTTEVPQRLIEASIQEPGADDYQSTLKNFCPTLRAYQKRHEYLLKEIEQCENEINEIIPNPVSLNRTKRGLINIIGEISKSLFGTATENDIKILSQHIRTIATATDVIKDRVHLFQNSLESYMKKDSDRSELLRDAVVLNNRAINLTRHQFYDSFLNFQEHMIDWINFVHVSGIHYTSSLSDILRELQSLSSGVHNLIRGYLPPQLVKPHDIQQVLTEIKSQLPSSFRLTHESPVYYYHIPDVTYSRHGQYLYIKIKIPLTTDADLFDVYKIYSLPIPINHESAQFSKIVTKKPYLAISKNKRFFSTLTQDELNRCAGNTFKRCDNIIQVNQNSTPNCMMALFTGSSHVIADLCDTVVTENEHETHIIAISPNQYFVLSDETEWEQSCPSGQSIKIQACSHCIVSVPCGCDLTGEHFFIPPSANNCNESTTTTTLHALN